ncbi:VOC family protein [Flavobacterium caeni]|nr:VOC family protein [Flavobacterium caeni]
MKVNHVAMWVNDLEKTKDFYAKYFQVEAGERYRNAKNDFTSYFLFFDGASTTIEIMHRPDLSDCSRKSLFSPGLTHLAISVGDRMAVDRLTDQLREDGYPIVSEPRVTGDGYYESVILDPERNIIEITE